MKFKKVVVVVLAVGLFVLAGCEPSASSQTEATSPAGAPVDAGTGGAALSQPPGAPSDRELTGVNLLNLGTLTLEGTEYAVTPEQAARLLPLWQMIASGSLQSAAETDAVVEQIEGTMTEAQMSAIDAMGLTFDDVQAWMAAQGIELPVAPAGGQTGPGNFQNMSEEERARLREQMQSLRDMTPEEREKALAEMGIEMPEGGFGGGPGGSGGGMRGGVSGNAMLQPLIDLLAARAAE